MSKSIPWSYSPYKPFFFNTGDIYICRVVPGKDSIHFEWLDSDDSEYEVYYRKRDEADFIFSGKTSGNEYDILNLQTDTDYEFYVSAKDKKSRVRLARCSEAVGRNAMRAVKNKDEYDDVRIIIRGGKYEISETITFTAEDSGTEKTPLVISSYPGEKVIFSGGRDIDMSKATAVTNTSVRERIPEEARDKVLQIDLAEQGLTGLGNVPQTYYAVYNTGTTTSLLWNGESCDRARWPNDEYADVGAVLYAPPAWYTNEGTRRPPKGDPGVIFKADAPRMNMWADAPYAWLYGYWGNDWSTYALGIKSIQGNVIFTKTSPGFGIDKGRPYYIFNLIEEMDAPGEWYIDKDKEILYIYPKSEITDETNVCFTVLEQNMLSISYAKNIRVEGIIFENSKAYAVSISNSENCELAGCVVRNMSAGGAAVSGGYKSGIRSCDFYNIGSAATNISGGNKNTLEPCGNYVVNCHIHNWATVNKVYNGAVRVDGVGQYVAYNKIHDAPHLAIQVFGNNHIIEYNDIYEVCLETADSGSVYMGQNLTGYGTIIRHNYFHDLGNSMGGTFTVVGVYFDDMYSGGTIWGNLFVEVDNPILIGGGSGNTITNNLFIDAPEGAKHSMDYDSRGTEDRWIASIAKLEKDAQAIQYHNEKWEKLFPDFVKLMDEGADMRFPHNSKVMNNISYNHKEFFVHKNVYTYGEVRDNFVTAEDIGIIDKENGDYRLKADSVVYSILPEFKPLRVGDSGNQNASIVYYDGGREDNSSLTFLATQTGNGHPTGFSHASFENTGAYVKLDNGGTHNSQAKINIKGKNNEDLTYTTDTFYAPLAGAVGIFGYNQNGSSTNGAAYIDNLVVTNTGYYPSITSRKNITDGVIKFLFPTGLKEVSSGSKENVKVLKDGVEVERTIEYSSTYPRYLTITIAEPQPYTEYTVILPTTSFKSGIANTSYIQGISNDKVISVKTEYIDFGVSETIPANNAEDIEIDTDVTVTFTDAVNFDSLKGNITIENAPKFTVSEVDDTTALIEFEENLDFGTTYTVELSDAIVSTSGISMGAKSFSFTTMSNDFAVTTVPADGARDVSVLDDMTFSFNYDVNSATVIKDNITVSPAVDFEIKETENGYELVFANELDYYTDYTLTFSEAITSTGGMPLDSKTVTFKTVPDMANALFYENFDGDAATAQARFTEVGSESRHETENFYVDSGVLKIPSYYSGNDNQGQVSIAQIKDSESWSDFEIDLDTYIPDFRSTTSGASVTVYLRRGTYGGSASFIQLKYGDTANNGIITADLRRPINTVSPYFSISAIDYNDAEKTPQWFNTKLSFDGTQNKMKINYEINGYGKTASTSFDSATKAEDMNEPYVISKGAVAFSTLARTSTTLLDNILVKDLNTNITADNIKNTDGNITIAFESALDTTTVTDNVKVYDGDNEVPATVTAEGDKLSVKVNSPVSGKVYRVKLLSGSMSTSGSMFANERYIDFSVQLDLTISNLVIESNGAPVPGLTGGTAIYAKGEVEYIGTGSKTVTLIMAVYDNNGVLCGVKTNKVTVESGKTAYPVTESFTLPTDVTDYSAAVFCWDDLVNIKPLSDSVIY